MADNGANGTTQEIMIADGSTKYIYNNVTETLAEVTDTDNFASDVVAFQDGYFIFNKTDDDSFGISALYDGNTLLAEFVASGDPDDVVSIVSEQRQVFVFKEKSTSVWYNAGDADAQFQRFQGGYTQTGCVAPFSAKRFDNSVIWLSENERGNAQVVRLTSNFQPVIVSTPEVNYQMSTYSRVDDAHAYVYQDEGHEFYVLTFPTAMVTWVYDASTGQWHKRAHVINGSFPSRERYNCHVFAFGKHLLGDYSNGTIYEMDRDLGTIDGTRIPRERTSGIISSEEKRLRLSSVQLDMEEGAGDPNDDTDTSVWLSYSKDGGHHYSDEIERSMGNKGQYATRLIWRRLGHARNWTFKIRTWSPNRIIIKGLIGRLYGEPL